MYRSCWLSCPFSEKLFHFQNVVDVYGGSGANLFPDRRILRISNADGEKSAVFCAFQCVERVLHHGDLPSAQVQFLRRQLKDPRLGLGCAGILFREQETEPFPDVQPPQRRLCQFAVGRCGNAVGDVLLIQPVQDLRDVGFQLQFFPVFLSDHIRHLLCDLLHRKCRLLQQLSW